MDTSILQLFWDKAEVGAATVSSDGTFTSANDRFCEIVEYTQAELVGMKFQEITVPADTGPDERMAREVELGIRDHYKMIKTYIKKSKYPVLIELVVWPLKKPNGDFEYFLAQIIPKVNVGPSDSREINIDGNAVLAKLFSQHKGLVIKLLTALISLITALAVVLSKLASG